MKSPGEDPSIWSVLVMLMRNPAFPIWVFGGGQLLGPRSELQLAYATIPGLSASMELQVIRKA